MHVFPAEYQELMAEMLHQPTTERYEAFVEAIVDALLSRGRGAPPDSPHGAVGTQPGNLRADHRRRLLGPRAEGRSRGRLPPAAAQRLIHLGQPRRGLARGQFRSRCVDLPRAETLVAVSPAGPARRRVQHPAHPARALRPGPSTATTRPRDSCPRRAGCGPTVWWPRCRRPLRSCSSSSKGR